jgi:protoporphyrinogen/coproporphyrinogen III oxidase
MPPRIVVVGGGISGLAAAYDLQRGGAETIVFEKAPRLGGVIETRSWNDCLLESGPDSFISSKPEALALIKELGLESEVIGSNDHQRTTYILKRGKLVPLPDGIMMIVPTKVMPMIRTPLLSWGTKFRMALELLRKPATHPDRSVADFVIDHFGEETLDYLAEPLLSGIYGGDPRQLSVNSVLPRFVEMESSTGSLSRAVMRSKSSAPGGSLFRTLKGGLGTLVEALSKNLRVEYAEVQSMERFENRFRLRASGQEFDASHVILAGPAWSSATLVREIDRELSQLLCSIPCLVPKRERQRLAACTFVNTKFPFRAPDNRIVLRCFFGGIGDEKVLDESDESLAAIARQELSRILGLNAAPLYQSVARWPRSMAQYNVGHADRVQEICKRVATIPGLHLAGNAYEGIGIPDCIRTGRVAAASILQRL